MSEPEKPTPPETSERPLRGRELRRALLAKLPPLTASRASDDNLIDVEEEMRTALELDADGVLEPLETLLERGRS